MKKIIKKYFNIYIVIALIGGFSFLYMLSFAFVINDVSKGSSLQMKRDMMKKEREAAE
ncbi:MAG: hypothetical protein U9Q40_01375 [Campylobacterota bacterium]|nr:hypothetical protein [Campylobacterota bacterium]